jgi:hypothetical protein
MEDLNTPLSPIDRSSNKKINKEILELNHTIDQMDLADLYKIFHPTSAQYTSSQQPMELSPNLRAQSKPQQISVNKITPCFPSDHSA